MNAMSRQWSQPDPNRSATAEIAAQVREVRFRMARRGGYDCAAVDDFLDQIISAAEQGAPVGPLLAQAQFQMARFQPGYTAAEVDAVVNRWLRLVDAHQSG